MKILRNACPAVLACALLCSPADAQDVDGLREAVDLIEQHMAEHGADPPPPPPPSGGDPFFRADLADYTVTAGTKDGKGRMLYALKNPASSQTHASFGYTIANFAWPKVVKGKIGKTNSVIAAKGLHQSGLVLGQQVIKKDGDVVIVHGLGPTTKQALRCKRIPKGLRYGIEPLTVVHTVDLELAEVFTTFTRGGDSFRCNGPVPTDTVMEIPKNAIFRLHQYTNHCDDHDPAKKCQEREAVGTKYREVWIELGDE